MTFINTRLSMQVSAGFSGGPMLNTRITQMANGHESRNAQWSMPHHQYTADYVRLDPATQEEIASAFMAMRGQNDCCRFKDWRDFKLIAQSLGVGDGTSNPRAITKDYTFGAATYTRTLILPIASTIVVKANGVPITVTVNIDSTTGLGTVTPSSPWPSGQVLTVDGEFDVRVRFAKDFYPFTMPVRNAATVVVDLVEAITP